MKTRSREPICSKPEFHMLAEGYGFGEIDAGRKDAFERHLLDCAACRDTVALAQDLRDGFRGPSTADATPAYKSWIPRLGLATAAAALVFLLLRPTPGQPPQVHLYPLERSDVLPVLPDKGQVVLVISRADLPTDEGATLRWEMLSLPERKPVRPAPAPASIGDQGSLHVLIDGKGLSPGIYSLIVRGDPENRLLREFSFRVPERD